MKRALSPLPVLVLDFLGANGTRVLAVGVFLTLGRLVLLVSAIVFPIYFRFLIRREERFLSGHYGDAYQEYARSVGRWWTWRPKT